jgi:hypothetical protein
MERKTHLKTERYQVAQVVLAQMLTQLIGAAAGPGALGTEMEAL